MCGRFTLRAPASAVAEHFALLDLSPFLPRYNVAPSQPIAVVRRDSRRDSRQGESRRELVWLRWGLVPSWAKDPAIGNRMINARSETAAEKPSYRAAIRRRRCLVVADGFYEWQAAGKRKQPYFIHRPDDGLFAMAGLWEAWEGPDHSAIESCTLLTTEPNELLRPIHDRMPVILAKDDYEAWLDPSIEDPARVAHLLCPAASEAMTLRPVGTVVNSPANDDPRCIAPADGLLF